jgi:chromosome segregation ATPase
MGCGSVLGDLFYLADSLLQQESGNRWRVASDATFSVSHTPPEDLRAQLYRMYGEGEISEEAFVALRTLADRGHLRPADLAVHRSHAQHRHDDPGTANALQGIRSRLTQLAQARASSEKVLANLKARLSDIDQRAADKEQAAREVIKRDEESARQRLAEKAELSLSRDRLAAQAEALRADLRRLEDLRAQLEAKSIELEAVQARSRLHEEMLK